MKALVVGVLVSIALFTPRRAHAVDPEVLAQNAVYVATGMAVGIAVASSLTFAILDLQAMRNGRRPPPLFSALELAISELHLVGGVALLAYGLDQHDSVLTGMGAVMMGVSTPMAIHGIWGLASGIDRSTSPVALRRAGIVELVFGIPQVVAGAAVLLEPIPVG